MRDITSMWSQGIAKGRCIQSCVLGRLSEDKGSPLSISLRLCPPASGFFTMTKWKMRSEKEEEVSHCVTPNKVNRTDGIQTSKRSLTGVRLIKVIIKLPPYERMNERSKKQEEGRKGLLFSIIISFFSSYLPSSSLPHLTINLPPKGEILKERMILLLMF